MSSPFKSTLITLLFSSAVITISTFKSIASNTLFKKSLISSFTEYFLRTLITASFLPMPRKPLFPFSTISYSILSLVVPSFTSASVIASSTVFAEISIYSIPNPYPFLLFSAVFLIKIADHVCFCGHTSGFCL